MARSKGGLKQVVQHLRTAVLPPKNAVFFGNRVIVAEPEIAGPVGAVYRGEDLPAWWFLKCGRLAEFSGVHDGKPTMYRHPPIGRGEVKIGAHGIYKVGENPLPPAAIRELTNQAPPPSRPNAAA